MKTKKRIGFFHVKSISDVMFLYGHTPFAEVRKVNNNVTKKDYEDGIAEYEKWIEERSKAKKLKADADNKKCLALAEKKAKKKKTA